MFEVGIKRKTEAIWAKEQQNNYARPYIAQRVNTYLETSKCEVLPHLSNNPDVTDYEYYLFRLMRNGLADQHFSNYDGDKTYKKDQKSCMQLWTALNIELVTIVS